MMFTDSSPWILLPCFGITCLLVNVIYNIFFHPLAKLPGPFLAKLTKFWLFSEELGGDAANTLARLHKKHGQLIRVSPNEVAINNRDVFTTINRQGTKFYKEKTFYDGFSGKHGNLFTYQDPEYHSRRKRLMSPSFSQASLADHQVLIYECMKPLLNEITENIRSQQPTAIFPAFQHFSSLKTAAGVIAKLFPKMAPDAVILLQTIGMERLIASRKATDLDQPGLFSNMQELLDSKEQKLSDEELVAESSTLFFAGTDTTASTVAIGLWHLLHKPDLYARLRAELKTIMPDKDSQPTLKELESLPLLSACIKEGLRITCPPRGRLPRVVPPEGLQCNGVFIPPGVMPKSWSHTCILFREAHARASARRKIRGLQLMTISLTAVRLSIAEQRICISQFVRRFSPAVWGKFREVNLKEYINIVIMDDLAIKLVEAE
ncbi:hypothetical protein FNYG_04330 [Fusarium nygamai]|uniref:Cytochrome P450 n=1 Tax=Gibberella nygamai TaxID=42673 RepID=A0A2K0WIP2_GIBNY|nr:hypothetical protein FNYG_04330 [Fusarium nygamai]